MLGAVEFVIAESCAATFMSRKNSARDIHVAPQFSRNKHQDLPEAAATSATSRASVCNEGATFLCRRRERARRVATKYCIAAFAAGGNLRSFFTRKYFLAFCRSTIALFGRQFYIRLS